jgi:hypothetical protein
MLGASKSDSSHRAKAVKPPSRERFSARAVAIIRCRYADLMPRFQQSVTPFHATVKSAWMGGRKCEWIIGSVICAVFAHGCAQPNQTPTANSITVDQLLSAARTQTLISGSVGNGAGWCIRSSDHRTLCAWSLRSGTAGWKRLAGAIKADTDLTLLCELPIDGAPREVGSCTASPKLSHRWGPAHAALDDRQRNAQARIDSARTLLELSRLAGVLPRRCASASGGTQICVWHTTGQVYGHFTVASSIRANLVKKTRLVCTLPFDGSARTEGSCHAEIDR